MQPEHVLNLSSPPLPGPGPAMSFLDACPSLFPGLLASIPPFWQSVIHPEPEGVFKGVSQIIPFFSICNNPGTSSQVRPQLPHQPLRPLPTSMTSSPPSSPHCLRAPAILALFSGSQGSKSLLPQGLRTCCSFCLECSSSCEHHLLKGALPGCGSPPCLSLGMPFVFISLWLDCW